jgi:filamentous hemagglutinin
MIEAGGALTLTTPAHIHNAHQISSKQAMSLSAGSLTNSATGKLAGGDLHLNFRETLKNTGEISADGSVRVNANHIINTGSGRLYGEHVALQAQCFENTANEGQASVVAARERLDIAAASIINRDQSLLTSLGDLGIGGGMDERNRAIGRAGQVENHHAEISAEGQITLGANTLVNTNAGLTLGKKITRTKHHEAVLRGHTQRHDWSKIDLNYKNKYGVRDAIMPDPDRSRDNVFYEYRYTRTISDDVVEHSQPGKILAGGTLTIDADLVINRDSWINAGGALVSQVGELRNEATPGRRKIVDQGSQWRWFAKKSGGGGFGGTKTSQGRDKSRYMPLPRKESLDLKQVSWQADSPLQRREASLPAGTEPVHFERAATLDGLWDNTGIIREVIPDESPLYFMPLTLSSGQIYEQPLLLALESDQSSTLPSLPELDNDQSSTLSSLPAVKIKPRPARRVRVIKPAITLPTNSLFKLYPSQNHHYLVETDPQFTQYKRWIGSDYMNAKLRFNPSLTHKRLGDGFYEQRLVRDQIMQLTGQRYLPGHANDNEQFKALMNAGVQFAQAHELTPGIMLSPRQMALLTSDMVWLITQTVTLADGSRQEVLVPQVYARTQEGDLTGDGALLSGRDLQLDVAGGLYNQGSIGGRQTASVTARQVDNGGLMAGQQLDIHARQDYQQHGGRLMADDALSLTSGGDIQVQSTLGGDDQNRWFDRRAGIYVQNADGTLELTAQNSIKLAAAELAAKGANSRIALMAGRDVQLQALNTAKTENASWGAGNYRHVSQQTQSGSQITGQGDILLSAGQDITAVAASISAQDHLGLRTGGDINLVSGVKQSSVIDHQEQSGSNAFSAFALTLHDEVHERRALASKLEGEQFNAAAGRDLTVQGSSMVSTLDLDVMAGRDLILTAAEETRTESHLSLEQDSGLMGGGGIGVSIGNAGLKQTKISDLNGQQGGVAGSIHGDVRLRAGGHVTIHASDVISGGDLSLSGAEVSLTAAERLLVQQQTMEQKTSGLTLALSGTVGGAVNNAFTAIQQAADSQSGRLGMLLGTKAALSGVQAVQAGQMAAADCTDTSHPNPSRPSPSGKARSAA